MAPIIPPQLRHKPLLRLHIDDISHPAAQVASSSLDGGLYLTRAIEHVVAHLYAPYGSDNVSSSQNRIGSSETRISGFPLPKVQIADTTLWRTPDSESQIGYCDSPTHGRGSLYDWLTT